MIYKQGDLLEVMDYIIRDRFDEWSQSINGWNTKDVNYDPPRVQRLYRDFGDYRFYLHKIYPCEEALWHPHPWPSAIKLLKGCYEMNVGHGETMEEQSIDCTIILRGGSAYEMLSPFGWHYVKPYEITYSFMLTAKPFGVQYFDKSKFGSGHVNNILLEKEVSEDILKHFVLYNKELK